MIDGRNVERRYIRLASCRRRGSSKCQLKFKLQSHQMLSIGGVHTYVVPIVLE